MPEPNDILSVFDSIVLGVVQGLTEFFPVSSDGHLALAEYLLNFHKQSIAFDVLLHLGTLGALYVAFKKDTHLLISQTISLGKRILKKGNLKLISRAEDEDRWVLYIWLTTIITGVAGILLETTIEKTSNKIQLAGIGFLITSSALFASWKYTKGTGKAFNKGWLFPVIIGLAQSSALFTGISRSGMTIATALLFGLQRTEAGRYSFVASIPIIAMAIVYESRKLVIVDVGQLFVMTVGVVVSFVVGLLALRGLMLMLSRLSLLPFAIYTFLVGLYCLTRVGGN